MVMSKNSIWILAKTWWKGCVCDELEQIMRGHSCVKIIMRFFSFFLLPRVKQKQCSGILLVPWFVSKLHIICTCLLFRNKEYDQRRRQRIQSWKHDFSKRNPFQEITTMNAKVKMTELFLIHLDPEKPACCSMSVHQFKYIKYFFKDGHHTTCIFLVLYLFML